MFEWLFKYPKDDFDAGALTLSSGYPVWLLIALICAVGIILALSLWRNHSQLSAAKLSALWCLQTAAAATLLTLIWQPALEVKTLRAGENAIAILIDNSASMQYQHQGQTRFDDALNAINKEITPSLDNNFTLSYAAFGDQLDWLTDLQEAGPAASRTNITGSLLEVLDQARAQPLAAVIVATDGSDNSNAFDNNRNHSSADTDFWAQLTSFGVPVHTVGIGRESMPEDSEITDVELATTTLPGSVERATVTVRHGGSGGDNSKQTRVKVYDGNNIIALQDQPLPAEAGELTVDIDIDAQDTGIKELRFEIDSPVDDVVLQNNSRNRLLQVEDKQRRILYFEGEPRWEYKFIRRAVAKSRGVALVTILRTTPNKFYRQGIDSPEQHANGFPVSKAELYAYDAVIIGNVDAVSLNATQHQLLHDFVSERGGAILMLAGNNALADGGWQNTPLVKALPVEIPQSAKPTFARVRAKAELTANGFYSAITKLDTDPDINETLWSELPELADFQKTGALKPGATALLSAQLPEGNFPLLSFQHYGKGNSYVLASSGTWRWQMQLPSEDQRHEIFWQQLLQTIGATATQRMATSTDRQIYLDQSKIQLSANVLDEEFLPLASGTVNALLTAPDGSSRTVALEPNPDNAGEYTVTTEAAGTGSWQIDISATQAEKPIATVTRWIHREDGTAESYGLPQDSTFLKRVANTTGGTYHAIDDADQIATAIRTARSGIVRLQSQPLWNMPLFFVLLLGLKMLEWMLRRVWGRL